MTVSAVSTVVTSRGINKDFFLVFGLFTMTEGNEKVDRKREIEVDKGVA